MVTICFFPNLSNYFCCIAFSIANSIACVCISFVGGSFSKEARRKGAVGKTLDSNFGDGDLNPVQRGVFTKRSFLTELFIILLFTLSFVAGVRS